ncbi:hypothetical protein [Nocardia sp. AB354]|uniref:hypothetical protein n=1 Tax=Nocardia sp. AB354 TaxID=3413283 RepID=UPI003C21889D
MAFTQFAKRHEISTLRPIQRRRVLRTTGMPLGRGLRRIAGRQQPMQFEPRGFPRTVLEYRDAGFVRGGCHDGQTTAPFGEFSGHVADFGHEGALVVDFETKYAPCRGIGPGDDDLDLAVGVGEGVRDEFRHEQDRDVDAVGVQPAERFVQQFLEAVTLRANLAGACFFARSAGRALRRAGCTHGVLRARAGRRRVCRVRRWPAADGVRRSGVERCEHRVVRAAPGGVRRPRDGRSVKVVVGRVQVYRADPQVPAEQPESVAARCPFATLDLADVLRGQTRGGCHISS